VLSAGVARNLITPQPGILTWGFSTREGVAASIESELTVTALVIGDGAPRVAIVAFDLGFMPMALADKTRRRIADAVGVDPEAVLINFSHTHSAPPPPNWSADFKQQEALLERYWWFVMDQLDDCVARASSAMEPVRIVAQDGSVDLGVHRREPDSEGQPFLGEVPGGSTDPTVSVIRVDRLDGSPLAILFSYGCHTVVVGPRSNVISADFPAASRAVVEQVLGGMAIFLQGGGGDVMPEDGMGYEADCTEERIRIGTRLGAEVLKVATSIRSHRVGGARVSLPSLLGDGMTLRPLEPAPRGDDVKIRAISRELELPLTELPIPSVAEAIRIQCLADLATARSSGSHRNEAIAARFATWADILVEAVRKGVRTMPCIVQVIAIGDVAIVGISAEVFSRTSRHIRAASAFPSTMALGYTNGVLCYLPPADAYPADGWSITDRYRIPDLVFQSYLLPTALQPECEQIVVDACVSILGEVAEAHVARA
jgi:neutral ceramidase